MLLSILSGVLCGLAFTNPSFFWLVYFALVPFLGVILAAKRAGRVFFAALFFALPFFGIVLWWMNELFAYAYFFANFAYFSLILYESLFLVGFGLTFYNLKKLKFIPYPLIAAAAFVVFEYLRSLGTFGITAGGLGYSQTAFLPMVQLARFFGSYGITFFIVLVNALLLSILVSKKGRLLKIALLIILISANYLFGSLLIKDYDAKLPEKSVKVAVIQGNIPQAVKLSNRNYNYYFDLYRKLSLKAHLLRPSIYVWPETALNNFIARRPIFGKLSNLAEELNAALIVGAPQRVERQYFNVAFCIGKDGKLKGVYQKQRLVPFG
ncbi:MAG: apolipoprotein N-acyltransferase, partial [Candidatus Omnitrophica bacterium]|nr:apolipoprotein N-acyltransferase [Candidatus Omnitrophota bacterium]